MTAARARRAALALLLTGLTLLGVLTAVPLGGGLAILPGPLVATATLLLRRGWWNVAMTLIAGLGSWCLTGEIGPALLLSAEALWLAVFVNRCNGPRANDLNGRILLSDMAFWLVAGLPLLLFGQGMLLPPGPTTLSALVGRFGLNGIVTTLAAVLLLLLLLLLGRPPGRRPLPLRGLVMALLLSAIALPSLFLTQQAGSQLQRNSQAAVLANLRAQAEAAARLTPRRPGEASTRLPASLGPMAFQRLDEDGTRLSSNPALFQRLATAFRPAGSGAVRVEGLQLLIPHGLPPQPDSWLRGYWSTELAAIGCTVQTVQPAQPMLIAQQQQSTALLLRLLGVLLAGTLLSERLAGLVERRCRQLEEQGGRESPIAEIRRLARRLQVESNERTRLQRERADLQQQLERSQRQIRHLSSTDALTGALLRSVLEPTIAAITARARDCSVPLSCVAFTLVGLQPINAGQGRSAGDALLLRLIGELKAQLHANDTLVRLGGADFLLVLWDQPLESARMLAERIRISVAAMTQPEAELAMLAGVSLLRPSDPDGEAMIARAEAALNQARVLGANQVVTR